MNKVYSLRFNIFYVNLG